MRQPRLCTIEELLAKLPRQGACLPPAQRPQHTFARLGFLNSNLDAFLPGLASSLGSTLVHSARNDIYSECLY